MRRPRRAGAGEGLRGHRVSHALPASRILQKGTVGAPRGKGQRGNEDEEHSQGHTGGPPWASPLPCARRLPHHKTEGPEDLTATQVETLLEL